MARHHIWRQVTGFDNAELEDKEVIRALFCDLLRATKSLSADRSSRFALTLGILRNFRD